MVIVLQLPAQNAVNQTTIDFMTQLLNSPNYHVTASELGADSDVELFLDFILCVRRFASKLPLVKTFLKNLATSRR